VTDHRKRRSTRPHPSVLRLAGIQGPPSEAGSPASPADDDVDFATLFASDSPEPDLTPRQPSDELPVRPARRALVEAVRLFMVGLFALSGWEVAAQMGPDDPQRLLVGTIIGSCVGYVAGGAFGRKTATAVDELEREVRRIPAAEILAGGIGLLVGLVLATLIAFPLYHLPLEAAYPMVGCAYAAFGYVGYKVGRAKSEELFRLFGVKPRVAGTRAGEVAILDSSAILDGRLAALVRLGFLNGMLLVPRGVLDELQAVADSSSPSRRARGRRALDILVALRRDPSVEVAFVDDRQWRLGDDPVDARLVRLAKERGGALVTNDSGLARVAAALDVPVRSIHALAEAMRPEVVAGDRVPVRLTRRGREKGQAVGYLDDGTMVVVEEADHLLGDTVTVTVTNSLQTSTGRLIFARVTGEDQGLADDATPEPGTAE
jgi:uncharacterized protein YacL